MIDWKNGGTGREGYRKRGEGVLKEYKKWNRELTVGVYLIDAIDFSSESVEKVNRLCKFYLVNEVD